MSALLHAGARGDRDRGSREGISNGSSRSCWHSGRAGSNDTVLPADRLATRVSLEHDRRSLARLMKRGLREDGGSPSAPPRLREARTAPKATAPLTSVNIARPTACAQADPVEQPPPVLNARSSGAGLRVLRLFTPASSDHARRLSRVSRVLGGCTSGGHRAPAHRLEHPAIDLPRRGLLESVPAVRDRSGLASPKAPRSAGSVLCVSASRDRARRPEVRQRLAAPTAAA